MRLLSKNNYIKNVSRLKKIISVFAKHGFNNLIERAKLGKYLTIGLPIKDVEKLTMDQRLRMAFEQLGPTFVKLGQVLATRPDLIPSHFADEFKKLHDQVKPVDFKYVKPLLQDCFGKKLEDVFCEFNEIPIGAASIAQVYEAKLNSGETVVVKVQRPGIDIIIEEDLNLIYFLTKLLDKYVIETKQFNLLDVVDEFAKTLKLETDFIIEANNIRKFIQNFIDDENVKIPKVYFDLSSKKVLVMEKLNGYPLSNKLSLEQKGIESRRVLKVGIQSYFKMVFEHGFFHGDLHAGNLFVLPENKIGLIDFGVVGRLSQKSQRSIANMLIALANENYDRVAYEYIELSPYSEKVDVDRLAREIRDILSPYYGLTLKDVNMGKLLLDTVSVASKHQLILPVDLIIFFKSIVIIEGMGRSLASDFDFLEFSMEFANQIIKAKIDIDKLKDQALTVARDYNSLSTMLPQNLKHFLRKINSPNFNFKMSVLEMSSLNQQLKKSSVTIHNGLVASALIIAGSVVFDSPSQSLFHGIPLLSLGCFGLAFIISFSIFFR